MLQRPETSPTLFSVSAVAPAEFAFVWPQLAPMVARGLRHGEGDTINLETIRAAVLSGEMQCWAVHEGETIIAAVIFRVIQHVTRRRLFVVIIAGRDMDMWADEVEDMLMDYRDIIGADGIEASCRFGMARYLERRGWTRKAVIMRAPERKSE